MTVQCPTPTAAGEPCKGRVPPGRGYCLAHDPERRETLREAGRKGGQEKSTARRAVKAWAAIGEQISSDQLPAMLRACMVAVRDGEMEPSQASAIATLAKTSVAVTHELHLEERIAALEEAAGLALPPNVRRIDA